MNDDKLQRLAIDLPPQWIRAIKATAIKHDYLSAAAYIRDLLAGNDDILSTADSLGIDLPGLERQWGGHKPKSHEG